MTNRPTIHLIQCGTHDDYKDPPHVPMITGMPQKRLKKDSLAETFAGAAEAITKAFSTPQIVQPLRV